MLQPIQDISCLLVAAFSLSQYRHSLRGKLIPAKRKCSFSSPRFYFVGMPQLYVG
nr:MAG TPA: hypothetical protein [Caudoviricetes sp.]